MRKLLFFAIAIASTTAFSQGNTLYNVSMVQAKMGQTKGFEKSWKNHVTKFHNGDDKRSVEEILTGTGTGNLLLISGPSSFADMDKEKSNKAAHDADYDLTVVPSVSTFSEMGTYRWADTLSYNGNVKADKYSTTIFHLKPGKMADFIAEMKRGLAVNNKIKSPSSYNTYIKMFSGSSPEIVIHTNLKDGFKQLDNTITQPRNDNFKNEYIQEYGQSVWDARMKLLPEIATSWETWLSKDRKDLSSATK
jgi:hypothetical protein